MTRRRSHAAAAPALRAIKGGGIDPGRRAACPTSPSPPHRRGGHARTDPQIPTLTHVAEEPRPFAIVTGASTGIGLELARCFAEHGWDLLIAADEARIHDAAQQLRRHGVDGQALQADLASTEGVERLVAAAGNRPVDALLPTPAAASARPSSTRTSTPRATCSTPT